MTTTMRFTKLSIFSTRSWTLLKEPRWRARLGDETEPAFHLIEPTGIGCRVMRVIALAQPSANFGMLVGGVATMIWDVADRGKVCGAGRKGTLMVMTGFAFGEHSSRG
jgi:hypothetical protein